MVELDSIYHAGPNWQDLPTEEYRARVTQALAGHTEGWITDGNYSELNDIVMANADLAVWLRLPFRVVYPRLAWRTVSRSFLRKPLWNGNYETLGHTFLSKDSMLVWGITSWRRHHRKARLALRARDPRTRLVVLKSPKAVERWLASQGD